MSKWADHGEKFLELRAQGLSYRRISNEIPVSVTTLKQWGRDWSDRIREYGEERLKLFVEQQLVDLESRLKLRGEQILKLQQALDVRDFEKMEDGTLLRVYLRYIDSVQREVAPLRVEVSSTIENYKAIVMEVAQKVESEEDRELSGSVETLSLEPGDMEVK